MFEIPEDLTALSVEDLVALGVAIDARQRELTAADGWQSDEAAVAELETLADAWDTIDAELAGRPAPEVVAEDEPVELADRAAAAAARFATPTPAEDVVIEAEVVTPDEGVGELAGALADGVPPHTNVQATLQTGAPEPVAPTPQSVVTRVQPRGTELAARLANQVADHQALQVSTEAAPLTAGFVAGHHALGKREGDTLDLTGLAEAITRKRHSFSNVPEGIHDDRLVVATATMDFPEEQVMGGSLERNFSVLESMKGKVNSLVASGGNCAPSAPLYDIFRTAVPHAPVEQNLPVVGASRGGLRFIQQIDWTTARGGIGVTTDEEDQNLGDSSGEGLKPCIHVDCPGTDEVIVTAISQCVEFGNLSYRTFPEQTANMLQDLAVHFADVKEVLYLNGFDAGSTAVTATQAYSANRSLVRTLLTAGAGYRLRNGMNIDAVLDWYVPVWAVEALKADLVADHSLGQQFLHATIGEVSSYLRDIAHLNVVWTYAAPTSAPTQSFRSAQSAGALNAFPTTLVSFLHAPGVFFRLDAGTLDVGLIRDSALNRTNDLQLFSEQWVEIAKPGAQALKLTISNFLPTGQGPTPATAIS